MIDTYIWGSCILTVMSIGELVLYTLNYLTIEYHELWLYILLLCLCIQFFIEVKRICGSVLIAVIVPICTIICVALIDYVNTVYHVIPISIIINYPIIIICMSEPCIFHILTIIRLTCIRQKSSDRNIKYIDFDLMNPMKIIPMESIQCIP